MIFIPFEDHILIILICSKSFHVEWGKDIFFKLVRLKDGRMLLFTIILWYVHYYQVMKINHHFTYISPPTLQILISIQITNAWWVRASQRLFIYFLVAGDPIYPHSGLDTQEVTNSRVKLHDEISEASRNLLIWKLIRKKENKNFLFGISFQIFSRAWLFSLYLHIIF